VLALDARVRLAPVAQGARPGDRFAILPYPAELARPVSWFGREIELRPIRPEDHLAHAEFLEHVEPEDMRLRFFSSRRSLPASELARLVQIDYAREMALVAEGRRPDGQPEILGVVRAISDPDNVDAEFAILVRSDIKSHGLGTLLMRRIIEVQRERGTARLVGDVLKENTLMRALMADCGFELEHGAHEPDAVRYVLRLAP